MNLELRDINPKYDRLLYEFTGMEPTINRSKLRMILKRLAKEKNLDETENQVIDLLLWFGVFGVDNEAGGATYIFDVDYNMNMIRAVSQRRNVAARYVIHTAFRPSLSIVDPS